MYATSVFYGQIYASLLPDRHSSSHGSHFLIRQCITLPASCRSLRVTAIFENLHGLADLVIIPIDSALALIALLEYL